jgi:hypothetical protein
VSPTNEEMVRNYLRGDEPQGVGRWLLLLVNPFALVAGWQALAVGLVVIAGTAAVAVYGRVHYDGVMDLHVSPAPAPAWLYAFEPIMDWLVVAGVFWAAGRIFSRSRQRVLDYFGTTALGRLPYLIAGVLWTPPLLGGLMTPILAFKGPMEDLPRQLQSMHGLPWLVVGSMVTLGLIVWLAVANYFALSQSSGLKSGRAIGVFLGAAVVAEIVSKIALALAASGAGLA